MRKLQTQYFDHWIRIVLTVLGFTLLQLLFSGGSLQYERASIAEGELWRAITGHFIHGGFAHLFANLAGLLAIWWYFDEFKRGRALLLHLLSIGLLVSAFLWLREPDLVWYVGLSGVLHGLLVYHLLLHLKRRSILHITLLVLLIGKLYFEQNLGTSSGMEALLGIPVIINAHAYGAMSGAIWFSLTSFLLAMFQWVENNKVLTKRSG